MTESELKRLRSSIISTIYFCGDTASVQELQRDLERTHGIISTATTIRAALQYLEQQGLVRYRDDRAMLTEQGRDVGALRTPYRD